MHCLQVHSKNWVALEGHTIHMYGYFLSDRNSDRWCIKFWETLQKAEKQWLMAITAWLVLDMNWFKHQPQMQNPFCVITQLIICY